MKLVIIILIFMLVCIWVLMTYTRFIELQTQLENAWNDVDKLFKERYALLPPFIRLTREYIPDQQILNVIIMLRATSIGAGKREEKIVAETQLALTLSQLFIMVERYPKLSAQTQYIELNNMLEEINNRLQDAVGKYNALARTFNAMATSFPKKFVAQLAHIETVSYF